MLPEPLHPAVVHFPIVFATLLPLAALFALWAMRRGASVRRAWIVPFALAVALTGSSWVAMETGEAQEERVEAVVAEAPLEAHEEAAERFLWVSAFVSLVAGVGLLSGTVGTAARLVATAGTVVVLAAGVQVGSLGGELVYQHGAASAYTSASWVGDMPAGSHEAEREDEH
jgi:4-amino-4-deoxy-L-arabinose transferase-like glycosyltransferase